MGVPYSGTVHLPRASRAWGLLGFLVALGSLYALFALGPQRFGFPADLTQATLAVVGLVFLGGFLSRKGKRGAVVGFLVPFLPLFLLGILLLVTSLGLFGALSIGTVPEPVGALEETLGGVFPAVAGLAFILGAFLTGAVGLAVGGLGGWVAGKVWRPGGRTDSEDWDDIPVESWPDSLAESEDATSDETWEEPLWPDNP